MCCYCCCCCGGRWSISIDGSRAVYGADEPLLLGVTDSTVRQREGGERDDLRIETVAVSHSDRINGLYVASHTQSSGLWTLGTTASVYWSVYHWSAGGSAAIQNSAMWCDGYHEIDERRRWFLSLRICCGSVVQLVVYNMLYERSTAERSQCSPGLQGAAWFNCSVSCRRLRARLTGRPSPATTGRHRHVLCATDQHAVRRPEFRSRWTTALEQSAGQDSPARQRHWRISSAVTVVFVSVTLRRIVTIWCASQILLLTHSLTHSRTHALTL